MAWVDVREPEHLPAVVAAVVVDAQATAWVRLQGVADAPAGDALHALHGCHLLERIEAGRRGLVAVARRFAAHIVEPADNVDVRARARDHVPESHHVAKARLDRRLLAHFPLDRGGEEFVVFGVAAGKLPRAGVGRLPPLDEQRAGHTTLFAQDDAGAADGEVAEENEAAVAIRAGLAVASAVMANH